MAMLAVLFHINPSVIYRSVTVGVGVAIFAYTLVLCIITGAPCNPLKAGTTKCLENVALSQAVLNIVSDFAVVAVPIPTIHGLNFTLKQKISVGCILALGSGVVICSIARLPYVLLLDKTDDVTYTEAILGVWSLVEVNLGIICACAMRLKRLVMTYLPQLGLFSSRSRDAASGSWGKGLRLDKNEGQHSYQLHSIQKGYDDTASDSRDIHVYRSYNVDVEGTSGRVGSTDKIIN
ncbi:hypothetical protein G7Z17_g4811 [Cylindrodendrum hubeiense]|uniref:Rhodopsin domain-containing protein n=1 Tax=Cylindrodendrum hubeiense TaxID=595255 RepID=A0A9P5HID9_9HYPO|nr:hypothetical protein G7Z17_g4811 [Cylindrodendrum hubeiense]